MTPSYCIYEAHFVCAPDMCSIAKCPVYQKAHNMPLDKLYELGLKERPVQQPILQGGLTP